jgi:hypothetical protein
MDQSAETGRTGIGRIHLFSKFGSFFGAERVLFLDSVLYYRMMAGAGRMPDSQLFARVYRQYLLWYTRSGKKIGIHQNGYVPEMICPSDRISALFEIKFN